MPTSGNSSGMTGNPTPQPGVPCPPCDETCTTKSPVRYFNGGVVLTETDLTVPAGGLFGHARSYATQAAFAYDGPNGFDWFLSQLPYAVGDGTPAASVAIVFDANNPWWFSVSGSTYTPKYGLVGIDLQEVGGPSGFLVFSRSTGAGTEITRFFGLAHPTNPGGFASHTDARGVQTIVNVVTGNRIDQLQRTVTSGGVAVVEDLDYAYVASGPGAGRIESVSYWKKVGAASRQPVKRAAYTYYGTSDANGSANDLKTATQQRPNGSSWEDVSTLYYRYYHDGDGRGFAHGLKLRFGPEAYRTLWNAYGSQSTIDALPDSTVKPLADNYFEYDPGTRAVTQEIAAVCPSCPGGGTTSDSFAYAVNGHHPADGHNVWAYQTVQQLPDGSQIIVFSNAYGQTMLSANADTSGLWITYYRYDPDGRLYWKAYPSACTGYDFTSDDLMGYDPVTGKYAYLRDNDGLIEQTEYVAAGPAAGQPAEEKVRRGQLGTPVSVRSYTYTSNTDANGVTVTPVASVVSYPDDTSTATTITTSYSYAWYTGTNVLSQKTTTLPSVAAGQNGSGTSDTVVEDYDTFGNLTQRTDERGVVNQYDYDAAMGVVTRQTLNVQSGVTAPGVNVVTDYTYDDQGRQTQTLGPSHSVVLAGTATAVRATDWTVYLSSVRPAPLATWGPDETRTGRGYATGTSPSYTYALVDPVTLSRTDKDGRMIDRITSKRTSGSGALSASDTFAQADWKAWSSTQYNDRHQTVSSRVYHLIPSSGTGSVGTNYGQADYGYDALERRNRVKSPEGTITRTVWETPQRVASVWVGTDDTGATDANPAGSGSPNNMVAVTDNVYDANGIGDGNLTQVTQHVAASDDRVTAHDYDWRDRRTSTDGEIDLYEEYAYDNLDRLTRTDRKNTNAGGNLIGRTELKYDDRNRVYQTLTYAVDPATGTVGNALTGDTWYDPSGNELQRIAEGDGQVFTKSAYNGVGWVTATYRGYNTGGVSYTQAGTPSGDTIFAQTETNYDEAGNAISMATFDRLNDAPATGTGSTGPLTSASNPKARVSYSATWYDGVDRAYAAANYGAVASFTRPSAPPARSDTELVASTEYDDAGRPWKTVDPRGIEARTAYDAAGRTTQTVEAYSASTADDLNRTTNYTYTLDSQVATMTAVNGRTGDQTTTYTYGTTLADSGVARNDLLRYTDYPGSVSGSDRTASTYNRQGQPLTFTDQRGVVRAFYYDKLGRPTNDCVTAIGTGIDIGCRQIRTTYEVRGMVETVTNTSNATPGAGIAQNQFKRTYNDFGQLVKEAQSHLFNVTSSTPAVQYAYASGGSSSNQIRQTGLTYPDGRTITYDYGTSGGPDDRLNRIAAIKDGGTSLAAYTYLGMGTVVRITYAQPGVWLDLWGGTSGTFAGLDRFDRVVDQRWQNAVTTTPADVDRYQYGYDRNSNRTWKRNVVSAAASVPLDEFYAYDQLDRLANMKRGTLTGTPPTGIAGTPALEQDWTLDPTGNWRGYVTKTAGTTDLDQARASNPVNQITGITETTGPSWVDPAYDAAGNMATIPQPTPTSGFRAVYDAWNRLKRVLDATTNTTVASWWYDGQGRRYLAESYTGGTLTESRHAYYTNDWRNVEERVGTTTTADTQYVWGVRYLDELVCRDDATPRRIYACQDANFNVTALASDAGAVLQRLAYEPYGPDAVLTAAWAATADAYAWARRFTSQQCDLMVGLYNYRRRVYLPRLGVFATRDPVGFASGTDLYEYASSQPVSRTDPNGLKWVSRPGMPVHGNPGFPTLVWVPDPPLGPIPQPESKLPHLCGPVTCDCPNGSINVDVIGNSIIAGLQPQGKGCITLPTGNIHCTDPCISIESKRSGRTPGLDVPILDHECCHVCKLFSGIPVHNLFDYVCSAIVDDCDKQPIKSHPRYF